MSVQPEGVSWQSKMKLVAYYPSAIDNDSQGPPKTFWEVTSITISRSKEQQTINTIAGARRGFVTVEGDFTGSFQVNETDPNLKDLEELVASNDFFDFAIAEYLPAGTRGSKNPEWAIETILAKGCKFENVSTRYDFGMLPIREYTFKYLRHEITAREDGAQPIKEGSGIYWDVSVSWD